jgi:alkylation response protein AidB-like acyl-CoA dehydrogenase
MGLQMCGPALIHFGTTEQKALYLPRILSGEHYWCQGYSEPGAGSDLASLQCRAVREGADYVINGTKIWTTHAHWANWIFLLVRTASQGKPQAGISFLLAPMSSPGIKIRPILSMSGEHEINQIFFDDVRVPVENRIGEENAGWTIAKTVLEFERGGGSATGRTRRVIAEIRRSAQLEGDGRGGRLWDDALFRARLAEIEIETLALEHTQLQVLAGTAAGDSVGNEAASLLKLKSSELFQHATELSMDALGHYALPDQHEALEAESGAPGVGPTYAATPTARYLNARARSIFGGSNEIQREILARSALGLESGTKGS